MKKNYIFSGISFILFILLIVLVKTVDVAAIGPMGTVVGLSTVNGAVHELFGEQLLWYDLTEAFGIIAILVALVFAAIGLMQAIKRKSLAKVDKDIYCLGGLYALTIVLYALFEVVVINYRPIIMPGEVEPEASFPSSHTMLICVIMGSTIAVVGKYVKSNVVANILKVACAVILVATVVGRLVCGVHWFSDILGGVLISLALVFAFLGVRKNLEK